jgi:hypothetical protein
MLLNGDVPLAVEVFLLQAARLPLQRRWFHASYAAYDRQQGGCKKRSNLGKMLRARAR